MKKFTIAAFLTLLFTGLIGCSGSKNSDTETQDKQESTTQRTGNDTSQGMYEYYEEVPVATGDQPNPDEMEAVSGKQPLIVDFSASWCQPCQQLKPYFKQMEETYRGEAIFRVVDIDDNSELARTHRVSTIPTVIIFADQSMTTELYRIIGFAPQELEKAIMEFV